MLLHLGISVGVKFFILITIVCAFGTYQHAPYLKKEGKPLNFNLDLFLIELIILILARSFAWVINKSQNQKRQHLF